MPEPRRAQRSILAGLLASTPGDRAAALAHRAHAVGLVVGHLDKRGRAGDPMAVEGRPPLDDPHAADGAAAPSEPAPEQARPRGPRGRRREVLVTAWPDGTPEPDAPKRRRSVRGEPPMPARIGRFDILRPLGSGGMSVVYEAYDARLDRTVALKLLRERGGKRRQARLLREAQALARLSHPNVVEVYETGSHEGRAYLVMERLPGDPLQRWLTAEPRSVQAVIDTFLAAGQGLAAAHAHGLVHRDFKPSNVLVGSDGRVRVFDFGLAAPSGAPSEDSLGTGPHAQASGPWSVGTGPHAAAGIPPQWRGEPDEVWEGALTRTGAMLGTPAYMSPEQYEGRPATAQSDQFAFCVALYEALWSQHPFVEREQWDLLPKHVMEGRLREPPPGRGVPAAVRRVIERGLAVQPKGRWPSMDVLLGALRRAGAQRRRVAWAAGTGVAAAAALGLGLWLGLRPAPQGQCTGASDKLEQVWGPGQRARVREAMLATAVPYADDAWHDVQASLDAYAREWTEAHRGACEGDVEAMDGRMACLERRRRDLGSLVEVLASADPGVVQHARLAVAQLEAIGPCSTPTAATSAPSDPALAEQVTHLRDELTRAKALDRAGRYRAGLDVAAPVAEAAEALGYAPLRAEAQLAVGRLQRSLGAHDQAVRALERAYFLAQEVEDDELAREASTHLAYVEAKLQLRPDEAARWLEAARVATQRVGGERARAQFLDTEGTVLWAARRREEALVRFQQALPAFEEQWGPVHPEVAGVLNNLGLLLLDLGRPDEALAHIRRSLAIREAAFGSEHPEVGKMLNNLGLTLMQVGRLDEAAETLRRAHALRLRVLGPDHPDVAKPLANLALLELERGRLREAESYATQALAIRERAHGADSKEAAAIRVHVGRVLLAQQRDAEAVAALRRAVLTVEQALGTEHVELVDPLVLLGEAERRTGQRVEALAHVERALELAAAAGIEPWERGHAYVVLARIETDRGEAGRARVAAEAARAAYADLSAVRRRKLAWSIAELDAWWAAHGDPPAEPEAAVAP